MSSPRKIILKSSDGELVEVDEAVALESQIIKHMIEDDCANGVIPLSNVTSMILAKVIEYCKKRVESGLTEAANNETNHSHDGVMNWSGLHDYRLILTADDLGAQGDWVAGLEDIGDLHDHQLILTADALGAQGDWVAGLEDIGDLDYPLILIAYALGAQGDWVAGFEYIGDLLDRECSYNKIYPNSAAEEAFKNWDAEFLKVDQATLFDLVLAANHLQIDGLLNLTTWTVADMIKGMTPEEIREFFNIKNDFTPEEEEKLRQENQWVFE